MATIEEIAKVANSVPAYKAIVRKMFSDHKCNEGRLLILLKFTKAVCSQYPLLTDEIEAEHSKFLSELKTQQKTTCSIV